MASARPSLQPGDLIAGKYRLESELGRGGMGAVYAARHVSTGRRFAIKLLSRELTGDAEAEARFLREATLASSINHPAIVEVYDVGREDDAPYMVMKLLQGETLGTRLKRGPMAPDAAVAVLLPVLHGIAAAHARGILHRDLKPENILLADEGGAVHPKVLDFGVSKLLDDAARTRLTRTGVAIGTPLYMPPEQVRGESDVDARADVYALGVIAYEMLTGALPYEGNTYADLILRIITGNAPGIRQHDPSLPEALEAVVARAMARDREDRYASVVELAADLAHFEDLPATPRPLTAQKSAMRASATPFAVEASPEPPARKSSTGLYALAVAGVLAAGAAWLWSASPGDRAPARPSAAAAGPPPSPPASATPSEGAPEPGAASAKARATEATDATDTPSPPAIPALDSAESERAAPESDAAKSGQATSSAPRPAQPAPDRPAGAVSARPKPAAEASGKRTRERSRATARSPEPAKAQRRAAPGITSELINPFD